MAKLMLVEDDNNLREIYEARLQAEGYTIVTAQDGEEALVVAKAEKPDLIVADVMMPKISGFEMLDILRNTDGLQDVKVIMLTALGQSDDQQRADKLGADRYLVKSQVTLEDIVKVTHELLGDTPATDTDSPAPAAAAPSEPVAAPATDATIPPAAAPTTPTTIAVTTPDEPAAPAAPLVSPTLVERPANDAESTAQETADVKAGIESFVAGATNPTGTAPSEPATIPATDAATPTGGLANDALLADAVKTLSDNSPPSTTATDTPAPEPATPAAAPNSDDTGSKSNHHAA